MRIHPQDLERFFNTVVVLNVIRELGRFFVKQSGYYLMVAEFPGSQLVNRDAALLLVVWFHISIGLSFRLELSNFDSEVWTVGTVATQAVLEVVSRLTAVERDAWTKRWARRLCGRHGGRRNTRLVVSASFSPFAVVGAPSALAKHSTERLAEPGERRAVVGEYNSRVILVEMLSEYAGTGKVFFLDKNSWPVACLVRRLTDSASIVVACWSFRSAERHIHRDHVPHFLPERRARGANARVPKAARAFRWHHAEPRDLAKSRSSAHL